MTCEPIFKKLKKEEKTEWDDQCQQALDKNKEYLSNQPVLAPTVPNIPLRLYLTVTDTAAGAMLAQEVDKDERAIFYISKKFIQYETRYTSLEKTCLALVWATKKLRHYMLTHTVHVISEHNPIKYLFQQPAINGRLSRWMVMLAEFDLKYIPEKSIKGKVVAELLAGQPTHTSHAESPQFLDEEILMTQ